MLRTTTTQATATSTSKLHLVDDFTFMVKVNFTDEFAPTAKDWKLFSLAGGCISKKPDHDEEAFGYFKFNIFNKKTEEKEYLSIYRVKKEATIDPNLLDKLSALSEEARQAAMSALPQVVTTKLQLVNEEKWIALCNDAFNNQDLADTKIKFNVSNEVLDQMLSKKRGSLHIYFTFSEGGYDNSQDVKVSHNGEDLENAVYLNPLWMEVQDTVRRNSRQLDLDIARKHIESIDSSEATSKSTYTNSNKVDEKAYLLLDISKKVGNKKASRIPQQYFEKYLDDRENPCFIKSVNDYNYLANNPKARMSLKVWNEMVEKYDLDLQSLLINETVDEAEEVYGEDSKKEEDLANLF